MARMLEHVNTINSAVRTLLAVVIVGGLGYGGWMAYSTYYSADQAYQKQAEELAAVRKELEEREAAIASLNKTVKEQEQEIQRLETAMRLLKMDHRLARLTALDQKTDPETGMVTTRVAFVEVNDEGRPIGSERIFNIKGDIVYIDYLIVKFEDKYVEQADIDRSTSICLFRRIFGEYQEPSQGHALDEVGSQPTSYERGGVMSDFERKIWDDFWTISNDPARAAELGIRAAHGDAVYQKVQPGKRYMVRLRASDGLSIKPEEAAPPQS